MSNPNSLKFVFFGTDSFSVRVVERLVAANLIPSLIVAAPDRPIGRHQTMTPPPLKVWADAHNIPTLQPEKLDMAFTEDLSSRGPWDAFALASYGKIVPQRVLDIPARGTLNVHPSLLPRLRGASPIETAILTDEKDTGVTIMLMDSLMDHGPVIVQTKRHIDEWPTRDVLENDFADLGGDMLAEALPAWVAGTIASTEQDHDAATLTKKIAKTDALLTLEEFSSMPYECFRKVQAYSGWPTAYFLINHEHRGETRSMRVQIKSARFVRGEKPEGHGVFGSPENGYLVIDRVLPEGSTEMSYSSFENGFLK